MAIFLTFGFSVVHTNSRKIFVTPIDYQKLKKEKWECQRDLRGHLFSQMSDFH